MCYRLFHLVTYITDANRYCCHFYDWSHKLLLALASVAIIGSESRRTHDHILLFQDSGSGATFTSPAFMSTFASWFMRARCQL
jgi:hypothetical protein